MLILILLCFGPNFRLKYRIRDLNYHSSFSCVFSVVPLNDVQRTFEPSNLHVQWHKNGSIWLRNKENIGNCSMMNDFTIFCCNRQQTQGISMVKYSSQKHLFFWKISIKYTLTHWIHEYYLSQWSTQKRSLTSLHDIE